MDLIVFASFAASASFDRPQYICLTSIGTGQIPTQQHIDATLSNLSGIKGSAAGRRRLCMSEQWSVLGKHANTTAMLQQVDAFLALSIANDLPVSMSIDATQWWEKAEHLWNWWNASRPETFNPANVQNVEWTGWNASTATKISWRNWGSQFRITADPGFYVPPPNFASPAFRAAAAEAMLPLVERIAEWYQKLPANKKFLLAYVRSTQELWMGTNYFYYPHGNEIMKNPNASLDPQCGAHCGKQLGYAAICGMGKCGNGTINVTVPQLDETINAFCEFANAVLINAGIPRSRIMCHTGFGTNARDAGALVMNTPAAAVTSSGAPAWSMYIASRSIRTVGGFALNASLDAIDNTPWGAPEWMPFNLLANKGTAAQWDFAFNDILAFRNLRLLVLQNWNSLWLSKPVTTIGIAALSRAVGRSPSCLVDAATALLATKKSTGSCNTSCSYALRWTPGAGVEKQTVLASAVAATLPSGALASPSLLSADLPAGASSATLKLSGDPSLMVVRWQVVGRGCAGTQTAVGDAVTLTL